MTNKSKARSRKGNSSIGLWLVGGAFAIVALIVVLIIVSNNKAIQASTQIDVPIEWQNRNVLGDPNAPVTVEAWEDFLCPSCGQWTTTIEPRIIEDYIKTGKAKLIYQYFPLDMHGPGAALGGMAAECAADQGGFWPYHGILFQVATSQGASGFTIEKLISQADTANLDSKEFTQCMTSQKYRTKMQESVNQAVNLQLTGTPSVIVDGRLLENSFDYEAISALIEQGQ
ncbi:MAG: DsbA family protein [Caldilineaceae bacterium]|nr:DsbA family protein [Caldilineaceae bacterium]MBP8124771.1 DsbA family protein [Caldilineaceae bacterium]MBP9074220.1 DsbA family protein [Caldilineaceae bacterium]